jgi:hypothetical protein
VTAWVCEQCGEPFNGRGTTPRRFCKRACADTWAARDIPDAETLRKWYWDDRMSCVDIGRLVSRDPKRVLEWLQKAGIETRPRGAASAGHAFKTGQPSAFKGRTHTPEVKAAVRAARLADGRVPYMRDGKHWLKGVTGPQHPLWRGGVTPERQAFYSTPEWKAAIRAVWIRDRTCRRCGKRPPRHGPKHNRGHVHHIVSFLVPELRLELSNLILLCADCHRVCGVETRSFRAGRKRRSPLSHVDAVGCEAWERR